MTLTQVQSVIQPNQQSVIQTATNIQPVAISKGNVILVSKPNSVIQTAQGSLQTLQVRFVINLKRFFAVLFHRYTYPSRDIYIHASIYDKDIKRDSWKRWEM